MQSRKILASLNECSRERARHIPPFALSHIASRVRRESSGAEDETVPVGRLGSRVDKAFDRASALSASWSGGADAFRRSGVSALSSSWSGRSDAGSTFLGRLANGPHYISDLIDSGGLVADGTGATWPPRGAADSHEGLDAWWDSVRRVGVLSVLELERQIGVSPTSLVFRRSLGSYGSFGALSDEGAATGDGDDTPSRRLSSARESMNNLDATPVHSRNEVEYELQELQDRRPESRDLRGPDDSSARSPTIEGSTDESFLASAAATTDAAEGAENVRTPPTAEPPTAALSASDQVLFETAFNMHPFAAAAFLRAFIACSFGLILFHVHSVLTWPEGVPGLAEGWGSAGARYWLLAQVAVLGLQIPLRMEVQRALFRVSTARDTVEATRRLQSVFLSAAWRANRKFGRVLLGLACLGPVLLALSGLWRDHSSDLTGVHSQLISVNSTNLLVFSVRTLLVILLLYFVRVAVPLHDVGEAQRARGLSEGTIRRLRRITYCTEKTQDDALTQCAVCLEHYDEGDNLMVLPCDRRHNFHAECIEPWLQRMNTCPLCQRGVPDEGPAG